MEKIDKGLSVAELEAQKVELLPDRLEMRRGFRNRAVSGNVTFGDVLVGEFEFVEVVVVVPE